MTPNDVNFERVLFPRVAGKEKEYRKVKKQQSDCKYDSHVHFKQQPQNTSQCFHCAKLKQICKMNSVLGLSCDKFFKFAT